MTTTDDRPTPRPGADPTVIIEVSHVTKTFVSPDGSPLPVLDDISLDLREGEIVALLGRSGSGKSTLLRCIAGLISPTTGAVRYRGQPLNGANPGVAMVFQSFALLPWLTVRQNVELGLEALGVGADDRHQRAERAIDAIGLDGFESAYPKELSGGMRQRVGFARALVVEPDALLMDEPFSALDVLTAQNLRAELLRLWREKDFPTKAMLIVTHNIEEAVILADRIFVLGANPGRIRTEIDCTFPQPRHRHDESFQALVDRIYGLMTGRDTRPPAHIWTVAAPGEGSPTDTPLPEASVGGMSGLLEILVAHGGREDLPQLAHELTFEVDDLLPLVDAAQVLGLAEVEDADLHVTDDGRTFVAANILESKQIFAQKARERAPLVRAICKALASTEDGTLGEGFFLDLLRRGFSEEEARTQLKIAVDWGRYGELFDFDSNTGQLTLDRPRLPDDH
ncbi:MAG: nitrate/sulfonate/bicarbonate ABC transporter ATP-binding protein [Acidimicrobiales bacterium]|jgi:NitT/TauT family transport system ATP-binding protein